MGCHGTISRLSALLLACAFSAGALAEEPLFTCRIGGTPIVSGLVPGSNNLSMLLRPDAGEHPVIAYFDNPPVNVLKLLLCSDADCGAGITRLIHSNAQPFSVDLSLALRSGGEPLLSFYNQLSPDIGARLYLCSTADCAGGVQRSLTTTAMFGVTTSVSLSPGDRPFVAFGDRRSSDRLHACRCDTADCATQQCRLLSQNPTGGLYPSTLWRAHDQTALIAHTATYTQAYQCANADCSSGVNHLVSTPVQGAAYTAMRARPDGRPLIVYGNFAAGGPQPGVPTLVDCADINCTSATSRVLDPTPRQLRIVRMAMRPGGRAFIVYGEVQGARSLYFYQCADRDCSRGRGGVISSSSEISFDAGVRSDDTAVIAFRPYQSGEIRLAYCSLPTDRIFIDDFDPR